MSKKWMKYLNEYVADNDKIEELEVNIDYRDGTKQKWIFVSGQKPVLEEEEDEEDEEDED